MSKKKTLFFFPFLIVLPFTLEAQVGTQSASPSFSESRPQIQIHNRILAKVNNKPITVMDVVKELDYRFHKQFPQYKEIPQARYRYYQNGWRACLEEMIEQELLMAAAALYKEEAKEAQVREEMGNAFGPNIRENLAQSGFTYKEMWNLLYRHLTVERMLSFIQTKARLATTPQAVSDAYFQRKKEWQKEGQWSYRMLTFRTKEGDVEQSRACAEKVYERLQGKKGPTDDAMALLQQEFPSVHISLSKEVIQSDKQVAAELAAHLASVPPGSYTKPYMQTSRATKETVWRILYVQEHKVAQEAPFQEWEERIQDELLQEIAEKEKQKFLQKLRDRFLVDIAKEVSNSRFEPFALRSQSL